MKTIVITGASDGVGAAAARELHARGHRVVLVGRSPEKTASVASGLGAPYHVCDFADLAQVRALAVRLADELPRIDVLANNAGLIARTRTMTVDGHELTMQVNHLAPFALTNGLIGVLRSSNATVISTASLAHRYATIDPADLDLRRRWSPWRAYGTSKLANVLFASELQRRHGDAIRAASFHPGLVGSSFGAQGSRFLRTFYSPPLNRLWTIPPERGADPLVYLAESDDFEPGEYFVGRAPGRRSRISRDAALAAAVWDATAELLQPGAKFGG